MLAACIIGIVAAAAARKPPVLDSSSALTIFRNNDEGYPFFRIPSLLWVSPTLMLAFAEARHQRTDHGQVALVVKRSFDNGLTWSPLVVVHAEPSATIGNPCPLYDEPEIVLFFCRENQHIFETRSADGGLSWSAPRELTGWSRPADWLWLAVGPPGALVTSGGRWVLPCDGLTGSKQIYKAEGVFSFVLLSDDRGGTWRMQSSPLLEGGNECQAAELPDGTLALNMRSRDAVRLHSISVDGGETWSPPRRALPSAIPDANCQGSMIRWVHGAGASPDSSQEPLPLVLSTSVGPGRRQLMARTSRDGIDGWSVHTVIEAGTAGYSAVADLGDGWAGCLYETRRPRPLKAEVKPGQAGGSAHADVGGTASHEPKPRTRTRVVEDDVIVFVRFNVTAPPQCIEGDGAGP
jgi:sialidase-1